MRSGIDIDRQDSGAAIGRGRELVIGVRLVITALSQIRNQALEGAIDIGFPGTSSPCDRPTRDGNAGSGSGALPFTSIVPMRSRTPASTSITSVSRSFPSNPVRGRQRRIAVALFMEDEGEELNQLGHA